MSEMGTTEDGKGRAGFAQRMEMLRLCAVSPETCQRGFVRVDRKRTASVADAEQTRSCEKRAVDTVRHGIHIRKHFNTPIEI